MTLPIPCNDSVLVEQHADDQTPGGLFIPEGADDGLRYDVGKVLAVGAGGVGPDARRIPVDCNVGETVAWQRFQGNEIKHDGKTYRVVPETHLLCRWPLEGAKPEEGSTT